MRSQPFVFIAFIAAPMPSPAQLSIGVGVTLAPPRYPFTRNLLFHAELPVEPGYWRGGPAATLGTGNVGRRASVGNALDPGYWGGNSTRTLAPGLLGADPWDSTAALVTGSDILAPATSAVDGTKCLPLQHRRDQHQPTVIHNTYVDKTV